MRQDEVNIRLTFNLGNWVLLIHRTQFRKYGYVNFLHLQKYALIKILNKLFIVQKFDII